MNATEKLELQVTEGQDGSATVVLPDDEIQNDTQPSQPPGAIQDTRGRAAEDGEDEDQDDGQVDPDPEREAIRQARREERHLKKKLQKARQQESNHLINALKRQNEQMAERLAVLEKRTQGADAARLDKAIEDAGVRLHYAKLQIKEATETADGAKLAEANEAWYEARRQIESLEALKKRAIAEPSSPAVPRAPDPRLKRLASDWMAKRDWYDPNGTDMDSRVAVQVDTALAEEGWDPTSPEYWEELDNRLTKYLPHRYNGGTDDRQSSEATQRRPRSVVTGSDRDTRGGSTGGSNQFTLSPERVRAIKEAGRWDNIAERNKMIRKYAEYDRMNRSQS